jgi:transposase InsO family protein
MVPYKRMVLEYAELIGKDVKSYREFGISKSTFYEWRKAFRENGAAGLIPIHWHVEDKGIRHIYIKPRTPELNGKVERSHRSDQEEFYQLLAYKDDVDLNKKLEVWERFYNYDRPHGAFKGKTPYEVLRSLLH